MKFSRTPCLQWPTEINKIVLIGIKISVFINYVLDACIKNILVSSTIFTAHQQSVNLLMAFLLLLFVNDHVETRFFL